ncbi:MAG: T9SS type A sorting domain-containing protein [Candidatus Delongbacteria bacterium]|nr:T9SS type A sorting domain-containing protein [Candidatus Delongbacteria bacterium]
MNHMLSLLSIGLLIPVVHASELTIDDFTLGENAVIGSFSNLVQDVPNVLGQRRVISYMDFLNFNGSCELVCGPAGHVLLHGGPNSLCSLLMNYQHDQEFETFIPSAIRYRFRDAGLDGLGSEFGTSTEIHLQQGQTIIQEQVSVMDGEVLAVDVSLADFAGDWRTVTEIQPSIVGQFAGDFRLEGLSFIGQSTADAQDAPLAFELEPNFPNPFNPRTTIAFSLQRTMPAELFITDLTGRRVRTLVQGLTASGAHRIDFDASALSSGMYVVTLEAQGSRMTRTMVLTK